MTDLSGRTVLLTGASRGIGAATAQALGAAGAHVVAHCRADVDGAYRATAAIPPERRLVLATDLGEPGAARDLWWRALAWRGCIDVLVANAATMIPSPLGAPDAEWRRAWAHTLAVNVRAPVDLMREAVRHVRCRVIVAISSTAAQRGGGESDLAAYAASKAALAAATQTIARARAAHGLLAYVVAPGAVNTELTARAAARSNAPQLRAAALPLGEWAPPSELGALVTELASGRWRHLSGATLDVNGAAHIR